MRRRGVLFILAIFLGLLPLLEAVSGPVGAAPSAQSKTYKAFLPLVRRDVTLGYIPGEFGYGMQLAQPKHSDRVSAAGFGWVKFLLPWSVSEPKKGQYDWEDSQPGSYAENFVADAEKAGMKVILRVDMPPDWAKISADGGWRIDPKDYADFMGALATLLKGRVGAYELWNEPNLAWEWGGRRPSPTEYTNLIKAAYPAIKKADPQALVITAGLASTGGDGGATSMNDVDFIRGMYAAGAKGNFDVLGSHPYGFASAPETQPDSPLFFRRAEAQRQVMVDNGDGHKQVWATEFNWLLDPAYYGVSCNWDDKSPYGNRNWQKVPPDVQADYLVRAYNYAYKNWPWMGVMVVFNLDFSTVSYYSQCEPMRWYAILNGDLTPRAAYNALKSMAKPTSR